MNDTPEKGAERPLAHVSIQAAERGGFVVLDTNPYHRYPGDKHPLLSAHSTLASALLFVAKVMAP